MTPEEIKDRIKEIIVNQIRAAEDPKAAETQAKDIHDVLTAKMREKVLGTAAAEVTVEDPVVEDPDDVDPDNTKE